MAGKLLVIVTGPTASGKTECSVRIAAHFQTAVLSSDSRQFYKEIPIGTAQPVAREMGGVPHYFIGDLSITETLSAGEYAARCRKLMDELFQQHDVIVLTGGSGLYTDAVLYGVDTFPEAGPEIRAALNREYHEKGIGFLQEELKISDPDYYSRVDLMNPRRLVRALEVCRASGKPYSSFLGKDAAPLPWPYLMIGLQWTREALYDRINRRVDAMIDAGLEEEASRVHQHKHLNALQTVGYVEMFEFLEGRITKTEAIEKIRQNSRNYAKRQLTWCRRHKELEWFAVDDIEAMISRISIELQMGGQRITDS